MTDGGLWGVNAVPPNLLWVRNWEQSPTGRQVAWYDSGAHATHRRCAVKLSYKEALIRQDHTTGARQQVT